MALLKYLKPSINGTDDSSKLCVVPKEVNSEISKVQEKGKKRGEYQKISDIEKVLIGRYASENGCCKGGEAF